MTKGGDKTIMLFRCAGGWRVEVRECAGIPQYSKNGLVFSAQSDTIISAMVELRRALKYYFGVDYGYKREDG